MEGSFKANRWTVEGLLAMVIVGSSLLDAGCAMPGAAQSLGAAAGAVPAATSTTPGASTPVTPGGVTPASVPLPVARPPGAPAATWGQGATPVPYLNVPGAPNFTGAPTAPSNAAVATGAYQQQLQSGAIVYDPNSGMTYPR